MISTLANEGMDAHDIYLQELESHCRDQTLEVPELAYIADHIEEKKAEIKELLTEMGLTTQEM